MQAYFLKREGKIWAWKESNVPSMPNGSLCVWTCTPMCQYVFCVPMLYVSHDSLCVCCVPCVQGCLHVYPMHIPGFYMCVFVPKSRRPAVSTFMLQRVRSPLSLKEKGKSLQPEGPEDFRSPPKAAADHGEHLLPRSHKQNHLLIRLSSSDYAWVLCLATQGCTHMEAS